MNRLGFHCNRLFHIEGGILLNGLRRGEFYNFPQDDMAALIEQIRHLDIVMSIHTPLVRLDWYPEPPTWSFLCDIDREKRELTMRMVGDTAQRAEYFGAEYMVVHFPSPPSQEAPVDYDELRRIALESCYQLDLLSDRYGVSMHLEGIGPSPLINIEFLSEVFTEFPKFRCCFDTGHMSLASKREGFDLYRFAEEMAPYVGSVHLWNTRGVEDYLNFHHIPIHPSQRAEDGWVDIARVLKGLGAASNPFPLILESPPWYPEALGDYDYRDGVKWAKELLETSS